MFIDLLDLDLKQRPVIALTGSGGKTTIMFTLASELRQMGYSSIVTTTTAIFNPEHEPLDRLIIAPQFNMPQWPLVKPLIVVWGSRLTGGGKLLGVDVAALLSKGVHEKMDCILVEADGSRQKPVKAPAEHEPKIPEGTTMVIGVVGLSALGQRVSERSVHRIDHFCRVTDAVPGEMIKMEHLFKLVLHPEGIFKQTPVQATKVLVLNQAEKWAGFHRGKKMAGLLKPVREDISRILITSFDTETFQLKWGEIL